jgi:MFS family permease
MKGLVYMAIALPVFFMSPLAGWLCDRSGPRVPAVVGLLFSVPFLILLRLPHASKDNQAGQVSLLCAILACLGTTLTFAIPPSMSEIALIAGEHGSSNYGQAYGLYNVAFSAGFMVGPLWGGYVTQNAGWDIMVGSLAGLAGVSAIPVAIWTGGPIKFRDMVTVFRNAFRRNRRRNPENSS